MNGEGRNPLRYRCAEQGCFNVKKRPKIEIFAGCFPRRCNFGDVDGLIELGGHGLLLEWKPAPVELSGGQSKTYRRLTIGRLLSVLVVAGDAETMQATHRAGFVNGRWRPWKPATIEDVKQAMRLWAIWAEKNPKIG